MNFHRQLAAGMRVASGPTDWWLAGNLDPEKVVVAYEPINAATIEDSVINVANPGTYDALLGVPGLVYSPTFTVGVGWGFNIVDAKGRGAIVQLDMSTLPAERITLVKVSGIVDTDQNYISGYNAIADEEDYWSTVRASGWYGRYGSQASTIMAPGQASGIHGLRRTGGNTTTQVWVDGVMAGSQSSVYTLNSGGIVQTTIGCYYVPIDQRYANWLRGTIGAWFIGQNMTDAEIINISNAMAAL